MVALQLVLHNGTNIPIVNAFGAAFIRRSRTWNVDVRAVAEPRDRTYTVQGTEKRYHRRRKAGVVTAKEITPNPSKHHTTETRNGRKEMIMSITPSVVAPIVMAAYRHLVLSFPRMILSPGIHGTGLFSGEDVDEGRSLIEYTGNRVRGERGVNMHRGLERLNFSPDILVTLCKGKGTIGSRGCGNEAMYVNHSCNPNAFIYEMTFGKKRIVVIKAIRKILAGEEDTIDYGFNSLLSPIVLICLCGPTNCLLDV